jgi:hypothetical protein
MKYASDLQFLLRLSMKQFADPDAEIVASAIRQLSQTHFRVILSIKDQKTKEANWAHSETLILVGVS